MRAIVGLHLLVDAIIRVIVVREIDDLPGILDRGHVVVQIIGICPQPAVGVRHR